jgi:PKD domain
LLGLLLPAATTLLIAAPAASAALIGPVYPVPGGPGSGHGGNTCVASTELDGAMGKGTGQIWSYGGGDGTPPIGCPYDEAAPAPTAFDTSRFEKLYWGISSQPQLALDGLIDAPGETLSFDPGLSDLSTGKVVWTGTTTMHWCPPASCVAFTTSPVSTRFTLLVKGPSAAPVALTDPAAAGIPSPAQVGGVIEVTPTVNKFTATLLFEADDPATAPIDFSPALDMFNAKNHPNPPPNPYNTQMGVGGAFWLDSRDPVASFTHPTPTAGQPVTFTSASTDPDGTIASQSWDLNGDNVFGDATGATAQGTYAAGTHTVRLQVTDDDGETTTAAETFTVAAPPAQGGGDAGGGARGVTGTADTVKPLASIVFPKQKLDKVLSKGLKGTLKVNEAATSKLALSLPRALSKKLGLKGAIGSATVNSPAAGDTAFKIKVKGGAKGKLAPLKAVPLIVSGTVTDTSGNSSPVKKSLAVRN